LRQPNPKSFTLTYDSIQSRLISKVVICGSEKRLVVKAKWDTGATTTCISKDVVRALKLTPVGSASVTTSNHSSAVDMYKVDIILPNNHKCRDLKVVSSQINNPSHDVLIGMDIITQGDFAVSNHNGKTVFTFRTPSMEVINFDKE